MANFELYQWELSSTNGFVDGKDFEHNPGRFAKTKNDYEIRTDLYPEPHMGNLKEAKVILLGLNPGLKLINDNSGFDCEELKWYEKNQNVPSILLSNLRNEVGEYPYYYLNPNVSDNSPGHQWLKKRIDKLRESAGLTPEQLSQKIACMQFFPYHSAKYKHSTKYLPSQKHNFQLVLDAIKANKLIVCMRSIKLWDEGLLSINGNNQKLSDYNNLIKVKNPRALYLTSGNLIYGANTIKKKDSFTYLSDTLNGKTKN